MTSFTDEEIKEIQYTPRFDAAMEILADYNGYLAKEIRKEKKAENPDKLKLITLEIEIDRLDKERSEILNPDCATIGRAFYVYAPFLKARFEALKNEN